MGTNTPGTTMIWGCCQRSLVVEVVVGEKKKGKDAITEGKEMKTYRTANSRVEGRHCSPFHNNIHGTLSFPYILP